MKTLFLFTCILFASLAQAQTEEYILNKRTGKFDLVRTNAWVASAIGGFDYIVSNKISPKTATDTLEIGHDVVIMLTDTISEMATLAEASGDLGKASTLMTNVYTEAISDGNFRRQYLTVTLADDATYNLPDGKIYGISYRTSDGTERSQSINVLANGSVTVDVCYGTLGTVNTDSDNKVCFYDGGTHAVLRNRTGAIKTFYLILWGNL